jgi:hypothetical protein
MRERVFSDRGIIRDNDGDRLSHVANFVARNDRLFELVLAGLEILS